MLRVGIDIDSTMYHIETAWTREYAANGHGHHLSDGLFKTWDKPIEVCYTCFQKCVNDPRIYHEGRLYRGVRAGLSFLTKYGEIEVVYITRRPYSLFGDIHARLKADGCGGLIFLSDDGKRSKATICKEAKLKFLVDDSPAEIDSLRGTGTTPIIYDQPYNRNMKGLRVRNWKEVVTLLLALEGLQA